MTPAPVCPAYSLAHCAHDFLSSLTEAERMVAPHMLDVWRRPEQIFPMGPWRSVGFICGRGWGKTTTIAQYMNAEVEAGRIRSPALMGPTVDRVDEVQIQALIDAAPPWFKPERWNETIRWPNGVVAEVHSAEAPASSRSSNLDFTWLCEIVAWAPTSRAKAFDNITTATRVGRAQVVWDTTSEGTNEIIEALEIAAAEDPEFHIIVRGTTFDNPMFTRTYLADECRKYSGQRLYEELFGWVFKGAAGALWDKDVLKDTRRNARPARATLTLVSIDPGLSRRKEGDETGIVVGDRGVDCHSYVHADESGHHSAEAWSGIAVEWCAKGAAGVIIESNHAGDPASFAIESTARAYRSPEFPDGMTTERLGRNDPFPPRRRGHIYIKEVFASTSKGARADGPATEYAHGAAHIVGHLPDLEFQLCSFVPGERGQKSPNRFDAHAHLVNELAGLAYERGGPRAADDVKAAEEVAKDIRARLLASARGRRVGM